MIILKIYSIILLSALCIYGIAQYIKTDDQDNLIITLMFGLILIYFLIGG